MDNEFSLATTRILNVLLTDPKCRDVKTGKLHVRWVQDQYARAWEHLWALEIALPRLMRCYRLLRAIKSDDAHYVSTHFGTMLDGEEQLVITCIDCEDVIQERMSAWFEWWLDWNEQDWRNDYYAITEAVLEQYSVYPTGAQLRLF